MHKLCTTYYVQQTTYYDVWRPYFKSDYLKKNLELHLLQKIITFINFIT